MGLVDRVCKNKSYKIISFIISEIKIIVSTLLAHMVGAQNVKWYFIFGDCCFFRDTHFSICQRQEEALSQIMKKKKNLFKEPTKHFISKVF